MTDNLVLLGDQTLGCCWVAQWNAPRPPDEVGRIDTNDIPVGVEILELRGGSIVGLPIPELGNNHDTVG